MCIRDSHNSHGISHSKWMITTAKEWTVFFFPKDPTMMNPVVHFFIPASGFIHHFPPYGCDCQEDIVKSFHLNKFSLRILKDLSAITGNVFLVRDYLLFSFPVGQCSFRCRTQTNMCLLATWRFLFMGNQRLQACAEWIWCKQNNMQLWSFDHICVTDGSLWLRSKSVIFFKAVRTRLKPVSMIQECTSRT